MKKITKTYKIEKGTLNEIEIIQDYLQSKAKYYEITETDVIHRAIFNYYWALFGTLDAYTEHIMRERGE